MSGTTIFLLIVFVPLMCAVVARAISDRKAKNKGA